MWYSSFQLPGAGEKENSLFTLSELAPLAIAVIKGERLIYVNPKVSELTEFSAEELLEMPLWTLFDPEFQLSAREVIKNVEQSNATPGEVFEAKLVTKGSGVRWIETWLSSITYQGEKLVLAMANDIHRRRLLESENTRRWIEVFDNASWGIVTCDPKGKLMLTLNAHFAEMHGACPEELVGTPIYNLFAEGERSRLPEIMEAIQRSGRQSFESWHLKKGGGAPFPVRINANLVKDESGEPLFCVAHVEDITQQRQAEAALREGALRYHTIFEESPIGLWEVDYSEIKKAIDNLEMQGTVNFRKLFERSPQLVKNLVKKIRVIDVNKSVQMMFRTDSKEELIQKLIYIFSEQSLQDFQEILLALIGGEKIYEAETSGVSFSGEQVFSFVKLVVAPGYEESWGRVLVSVHDITSRKRAEEALRKSEARYRELFNEAPISLWEEDLSQVRNYLMELREQGIVDLRAHMERFPEVLTELAQRVRVTDVNKASVELFGARSKEELLRDLSAVLGGSMDYFKEEILALNSGKLVYEGESKRQVLDGRLIEVCLRLSIPAEFAHDWSKAILSIADLTERKRLERVQKEKAIAESANRSKTAFLANMSHEIRTPMTAILGFSEMLLDGTQSSVQRWECVQRIQRNGQHLLNLIGDILDVAKIESDQLVIRPEKFVLETVLADVYSLFEFAAKEKDLEFGIYYEGLVPASVCTDRLRLHQILINMVGNAIKFTSQGEVKVSLRLVSRGSSDGILEFVISDTGRGIEEEHQERLFYPFSQGDDSVSRVYGGTGLGLCLSKQLANLMGGSLVLERSRPGEGTVFRVALGVSDVEGVTFRSERLILASEDSHKIFESFGRERSLRGLKVLLIEDNEEIQKLLAYILSVSGAIVEVSTTALEGIEKALNQQSDVVLMDIQMPKVDGYRAIRLLREGGYTGPVLALTAHVMAEEKARCLNLGFTGYLTKPIEPKRLIAALLPYQRGA